MLESFQKNKKGILLMLCSALCVCVGQLLWKLSVEKGFFVMLAGFCFYGTGALVMLYAYRFGRVSVLQPMLSFSYLLSNILGTVVLHEPFTMLKSVGTLIIMAGVILIAGGDTE